MKQQPPIEQLQQQLQAMQFFCKIALVAAVACACIAAYKDAQLAQMQKENQYLQSIDKEAADCVAYLADLKEGAQQ